MAYNPDKIGKLRLQQRAATLTPFPAAGEVVLVGDSVSGNPCMVDSTGAVTDLLFGNGKLAGFNPSIVWDFTSTVEGWTVANGTLAWDAGSGGSVLFADTSAVANASIVSPTFSLSGSINTSVRILITRNAGSGWIGDLQYSTTSAVGSSPHANTLASFRKTINAPAKFAIGDTILMEWDMSTQTTGGTDWVDNTVSSLRFILPNVATIDDVFRIHWVAIGQVAPAQPRLNFKDEGTLLTASAGNINSINATGAGVVASVTGTELTLNIPGGAAGVASTQLALGMGYAIL